MNTCQSHLCGTNHRELLKGKMPTNYRELLAIKFRLKKPTIDSVLGGRRKDKHGVIQEAYRMALDHASSKKSELTEIEQLMYQVSKL